jgi:hypothetical protein
VRIVQEKQHRRLVRPCYRLIKSRSIRERGKPAARFV